MAYDAIRNKSNLDNDYYIKLVRRNNDKKMR